MPFTYDQKVIKLPKKVSFEDTPGEEQNSEDEESSESEEEEVEAQLDATANGILAQKSNVSLEGKKRINWLVKEFFEMTVSTYQDTVKGICTDESCAVMSGGPTYKYLWADGDKVKKPISVSAPQYLQYMKEWCTNLIESFPSSENQQYPKDFVNTVKTITRRLFRVYVHIYYFHFSERFWTFAQQYNLIDDIEVKPLKPLITTMFDEDKKSPILRSKSDSSVSSSKEEETASPKENPSEPKQVPSSSTEKTVSNTPPSITKDESGNVGVVNEKTTNSNPSPNANTRAKKQLKLLVEYEGVKRRCDIEATSTAEVSELLQQKLAVGADIMIEYFDEEFNDFAQLEDFNHLSEKAKLRVTKAKPKPITAPVPTPTIPTPEKKAAKVATRPAAKSAPISATLPKSFKTSTTPSEASTPPRTRKTGETPVKQTRPTKSTANSSQTSK